MERKSKGGFTEAELASFEWSKSQLRGRSRDREREKRYSSRCRDGNNHGRYYSDSSDSDNPREPFNPLKLAHSRYRKRAGSHKTRSRRSDSDSSQSPKRWEHDLYDDEVERASKEVAYRRRYEERSSSRHRVDTRRGAWRSRAGGVYIPPDDPGDVEEDLYSSHRPTSSTDVTKKRDRSRSNERPDPVYTLD